VCRASSMPSARRASLAAPMPQPPEETSDARAVFPVMVACCQRRLHAQALLGLGSGDRFGGVRGGSGSLEGRAPQAEKPAESQGKRATKRYSPIA
jgi:hypothetical protein